MRDAVTAESGGSPVDRNAEAEAVGDGIVTPDPDMSSGTAGNEIELAETQPLRQSAEILNA